MKKTLRKYLSVLVLFCLALQFAPFGLVHTHDDHHETEAVHASHIDQDSDNDADVQFEISDDCDFCHVLHAINDQSFALSNVQNVVLAEVYNETSTFVVTTAPELPVASVQGRAPPAA